MTTVWSSKLVHRGEGYEFALKFDGGDWIIEGRGLDRNSPRSSVKVPPEAMDAIVAEWPKFKASVGDRGGEK